MILTGTGSDGALGAREVKAAGGTVRDPEPRHGCVSGMPAALAPSHGGYRGRVERIGPLLADLLRGGLCPANPSEPDVLETLLAQVRTASGIEFTSYKTPTILRRLQRRMVATNMPTAVDDYLQYLAQPSR